MTATINFVAKALFFILCKISLCVSKKMLRIFFEEGDRAEFGPQSTFSTYTPPKK